MVDRRVLAAAFLLAFVALAGCHALGTIEQPVCHACEAGVEGVEEPSVTVESSSLRVDLRADGSGRFTVESDLSGDGVERLRTNDTAVERLAERAVAATPYRNGAATRPIHGGNVSNLTASFENGTLTVGVTVADAARQGPGGTLLVDYLHTEWERPPDHVLGADEVTFRGPPGTVVTNDPPGGRVTEDGRAVVWTGSETRVSSHTYVTYGPDRSAGSRAAGQAAIASHVVRWAGPRIVATAAGPAVGLAVLFAVLWLVVYWLDDALTAPWNRQAEARPTGAYRDLATDLAVGAVLVAVGVVVPFGLRGLLGDLSVPFVLVGAIAAALLLAAGAAVGRSRRWSRVATTLAVCSPFVLAAVETQTTPGPFGAYVVRTAPVWAVLCLLVSPLFFVGRYLGRRA
jgi:hypothetical protein